MMREHGKIGRHYAGKVTQVISGLDRLRRLGVGRGSLRGRPAHLQEADLRDALRRGEREVRRVRSVLHRPPVFRRRSRHVSERRAARASGVSDASHRPRSSFPFCVLCVFCGLWTALPPLVAQPLTAIDKAFADFWKADEAKNAEKAAESLIKAGVDFDTAWARLKAGRPYGKERTGELSMRATAGAGVLIENAIEIPDDYTPEHPWGLRVQLHGGVNRQSQQIGGAALEEDNQAAGGGGRAPSSAAPPGQPHSRRKSDLRLSERMADAAWWHAAQVDNILRVVDRHKRRYNVDESRIYLTGISDGGTGVYYMALKSPTVWSSFLPLNGSIKVLGNPALCVTVSSSPPTWSIAPSTSSMATRSAVSRGSRGDARGGVQAAGRRARLPSAAHGGPRHELVAVRARPVRTVRQAEGASGASGPGVVGDQADGSLQSRRLADHRAHRSGAADATSRTSTSSITGVRRAEWISNAAEMHSKRRMRRPRVHAAPVARCDRFDRPTTVTVNGKQAYQGSVKRDPGCWSSGRLAMPIVSACMAPNCGCKFHEEHCVDLSAGYIGRPRIGSAEADPHTCRQWRAGLQADRFGVADQFDATWQRLKEGPKYTTQKTGAFQIRYPFSTSVELRLDDVPAD